MWSEVFLELGIARELQLEADTLLFQLVLAGGAKIRRYENPKAPQKRSFVGLDSNEERDIADTSAGKELTRERDTVEDQHRSQLAEIHQEINQASKETNALTKQELEAAHTELEKELARSETDRERLSQDNVEDKDRIEEKLRREQAARKQQSDRERHPHFEGRTTADDMPDRATEEREHGWR